MCTDLRVKVLHDKETQNHLDATAIVKMEHVIKLTPPGSKSGFP
jgi:hypothetical protein